MRIVGLDEPLSRFLQIAMGEVGVRETGKNDGPDVRKYQLALDGVAQREPWCAAFVVWCLRQVEAELGVPSGLVLSEHVATMWNKSPQALKGQTPRVGSIFCWRKIGTAQGHMGIVEALGTDGKTILTIEGNTGSGDIREGDGVYRKRRPARAPKDFMVLGYLYPWLGYQRARESKPGIQSARDVL